MSTAVLGNNPYYREEKKNRIVSASLTLFASAALVALLFLLGMYYQNPPPAEQGMLVALGEPEAGMKSDFNDVPPPNTTTLSQPIENSDETQETEEAPEITKTTEPQVKKPQETKPEEKPERKVDQNALFNPKPDNGKKQSEEGNQNKEGKKGLPTGDPSGNPVGGGWGKGADGTLFGPGGVRNVKQRFNGTTNCKQTGIVMVKIQINRSGRVVGAKAVLVSGSTTITDLSCEKEAENSAKEWLFESNADAPEIQEAILTVRFKVN
jgi:outer membrane biosynthesis protein TonB